MIQFFWMTKNSLDSRLGLFKQSSVGVTDMHVCSRYSGGSHKPLVEERQEEEPVGGLLCSLKNTDLGS